MAGAAGARWEVIVIAGLYALGAHGIMTLNDFKAIEGDIKQGVNSLPVTLGPERAAKLACWVMTIPQLLVLGLLISWDIKGPAAVVALVIAAQLLAMGKMLKDPKGLAPWYNGTGVVLYVSGMMASAVALGGLA
jgi:chlorophyll synthase